MAQIHEGRRLGPRDDYKDEDQVILEVTPPAFVASVNSLPDWSEPVGRQYFGANFSGDDSAVEQDPYHRGGIP
ncbi:hypothetical protein Forpe1208_v010537 [Fusarium oxysporum f. sp. rapae]|uniref:Uncharacterized protein n=1 Tax=Fusarium oxysporum f. sp. rapae TaxID=485398 RepID=A0A8J5U615_FUSOX|nr:hypothetical protein Forpe1208_v010537 [Fusarium oxysporum f. sp. rapae]